MHVTNASLVPFCVDYGARKGRVGDAEKNGWECYGRQRARVYFDEEGRQRGNCMLEMERWVEVEAERYV